MSCKPESEGKWEKLWRRKSSIALFLSPDVHTDDNSSISPSLASPTGETHASSLIPRPLTATTVRQKACPAEGKYTFGRWANEWDLSWKMPFSRVNYDFLNYSRHFISSDCTILFGEDLKCPLLSSQTNPLWWDHLLPSPRQGHHSSAVRLIHCDEITFCQVPDGVITSPHHVHHL